MEQHPQKSGHHDDKRHPNREIYKTFTGLNQEISVSLNEMEKRYWHRLEVRERMGHPWGPITINTIDITAANVIAQMTIRSLRGISKP